MKTKRTNQEIKRRIRQLSWEQIEIAEDAANKISRRSSEKSRLRGILFRRWLKTHKRQLAICFTAITLAILTMSAIPTFMWILLNSIVRYNYNLPVWQYLVSFAIVGADYIFVMGRFNAMDKRSKKERR